MWSPFEFEISQKDCTAQFIEQCIILIFNTIPKVHCGFESHTVFVVSDLAYNLELMFNLSSE